MTFEEQIIKNVQHGILKQISECKYIEYHHKNKKHVPDDIVEKAWDGIDWEYVIKEVRNNLEQKLINVISGNMLTEAGTDAKRLLSIQGVRERLRAEAYPKIKEVLDNIENK